MPDPIYPAYQPSAHGGRPDTPAVYPMPVYAVAPQNPSDPAVELIRSKIEALYAQEPDAAQELAEVQAATRPGSVHQQYMAQLNKSGISLSEIQTAWHNYYVGLPDAEKYQVWQEFYVVNGSNPAYQQLAATPAQHQQPGSQQPAQSQTIQPQAAQMALPSVPPAGSGRSEALGRHSQTAARKATQTSNRLKEAISSDTAADIKNRILSTVKNVNSKKSGSGKRKLTKKHHLHSLAFGLASGLVVLFIFMFGFFNELLIAPLVQPSRRVNDTPVIVDVASTVISGGPKIVIPKINVEIPIDYSQTTTSEKAIELALDNGIVHYPTTVKPGQAGNGAYFGHSSNNIFNPGKYKFAFVLLHQLVEGDTFYLSYEGKTYAYRVFSKRIVKPTEVSVLGPIAGKVATATLITCDPPGTSINRLVVVGEQISPDPGDNAQPPTPSATPQPIVASAEQSGLPGNGPTLWSRIWGSIF